MGNRSCLENNNNEHFMQDKLKWEGEGMLTHMLAYKLYDIPNTCGPDWDVCATFDFERPVSKAITASNVEERAKTLLDQYRKKHKAFSHNNLLVPLGDDFKYKNIDITRKMMDSYQKMFDYINSQPSLKAKIRFATLSEYFSALKHSVKSSEKLPRYDGDFFTYSDTDNDYWSGYFTTRPFLKKTIRTTENQLRTAQILFSLIQSFLPNEIKKENYNILKEASETLGLLQHHDAITGTAKQVVVNDYIHLLTNSKKKIANIASKSLLSLICENQNQFSSSSSSNLPFIQIREDQTGKPEGNYKTIQLNTQKSKSLVVFNSLSSPYTGIIKIKINTCNFYVWNEEDHSVVPVQIYPVYGSTGKFKENEYWVIIPIHVTELAWQIFTFKSVEDSSIDISLKEEIKSKTFLSKVFDLQSKKEEDANQLYSCTFHDTTENGGDLFSLTLSNSHYESIVLDSSNGFLKSIKKTKARKEIQFNEEYRMYNTRGGSYLFSPTGESDKFSASFHSFLYRGELFDMVQSFGKTEDVSFELIVHHTSIHQQVSSPSSSYWSELEKRIEIQHHVNLNANSFNNKEFVVRLNTNLQGKTFWTDSASLDMIQRDFEKNRPIQANFYPVTSLFVKRDATKDSDLQLSVLFRHALGAGVRGEGNLFEFMLDRRTMQDDARGMGEKVTDQVPIDVCFLFFRFIC